MFVGVDGGGTRVRAVLVDGAGAVLRRAEGPAALVDARHPDASAAVVAAVVAELGAPVVQALCCGLAGAGRPAEREAVASALSAAAVAERVLVVSDAEAALHDAFGGGAGVLVIAGTGSIALARNRTGAIRRAGGWGRLLGDEGSGYALGLAGLRAIVRAADGRGEQTALTTALLRATGCGTVDDLIAYAARAAKADIAALAPVVLQHAEADAVAGRIRTEAVAELVLLGTTAARRAALEEPEVAFTGGLIEPDGPLRSAITAAFEQALPRAAVRRERVDAARGAAALALASV